jgi:hypothetical protein
MRRQESAHIKSIIISVPGTVNKWRPLTLTVCHRRAIYICNNYTGKWLNVVIVCIAAEVLPSFATVISDRTMLQGRSRFRLRCMKPEWTKSVGRNSTEVWLHCAPRSGPKLKILSQNFHVWTVSRLESKSPLQPPVLHTSHPLPQECPLNGPCGFQRGLHAWNVRDIPSKENRGVTTEDTSL